MQKWLRDRKEEENKTKKESERRKDDERGNEGEEFRGIYYIISNTGGIKKRRMCEKHTEGNETHTHTQSSQR